jgi:8-oxo-dGTP diphosphatase
MDRPLVGIAVLIRQGGRVLLGLRKKGHAGGMWGCPGGHLEGGESFETCALRETEEETGIMLAEARLWTVVNTVFHREGKHYVCVFVIADMPNGQEAQVIESEKCERWGWFPWNRLPAPLMPGLEMLVSRRFNPFNEG